MKFVLNLLATVALILFSINEISFMVTGRNFDESALYQLTYGFEAVNFRAFIVLIATSIALLFIAGLVLFFFNRILSFFRFGRFKWLIVTPMLIVYIYTNAVTGTLAHVFNVYMGGASIAQLKEYKQRFKAISQDVRPTKNIVFVYLESFERTFLDESRFPDLVPNIARLEKTADHFTEIEGLISAEWTMGGMVASQCGIPLVTPIGSSNSMGRVGSFLSGATCLGDVLKASGYHLEYIGGAPKQFAGKDKFYLTHGFHSVRGMDELHKEGEAVSEWGRFDSDTLDDVVHRYEELLASKDRFGLFALTLDTHAPHGYVSPACGDLKYGDGTDAMLNAVHCNDRVVSNFIERIRSVPGSENTLVVVGSDHLSMLNTATAKLNEGPRRNLLMVFDGDNVGGRVSTKKGTTLDVGATIFDYLTQGEVVKFGLGRSLRNPGANTLLVRERTSEAVARKIENWRGDLLSYWKFGDSLESGFSVGENMSIDVNGAPFAGPAVFDLTKDRINQVHLDGVLDTISKFIAERTDALLIDSCDQVSKFVGDASYNDGACYLYNDHKKGAFSGQLEMGKVYLPDSLTEGEPLSHKQESRFLFVAKTGSSPDYFHAAHDIFGLQPDLKITSAGFNSGVFSRVVLGESSISYELTRGLNIISVDDDNSLRLVGTIDSCSGDTTSSDALLSSVELAKGRYIGVVFDTFNCGSSKGFEEISRKLGIKQWKDIGFRSPYIALFDRGAIHEYIGSANEKLTVWNHNPEDIDADFLSMSTH